MSDFGEYLADVAASGGDVSAPVPLIFRPLARMRRQCPASVMADEYTLECGPAADGAQGDPATLGDRASHETENGPHSS
jgi:hypothetical protein